MDLAYLKALFGQWASFGNMDAPTARLAARDAQLYSTIRPDPDEAERRLARWDFRDMDVAGDRFSHPFEIRDEPSG